MSRRLLLVGAGHAHALVLREFAHSPPPEVALTVVSPTALAPYSGMVPGWLAGTYRFEDICIDFRTLAAAAGAEFVQEAVVGLGAGQRQVRLASGACLSYDLLSLDIGSSLSPPLACSQVMPLRPISRLRENWEAWLTKWQAAPAGQAGRVVTVGAGAAGVEVMLAVLARLRALRPDRPIAAHLVSRSPRPLPGFAPAAVRAAERALDRAGVLIHPGTDWQGSSVAAECGPDDLLLWATGAQAHDWLREAAVRHAAGDQTVLGGLGLDADGFIPVDTMLQSVTHPTIFATGDCAHWIEGGNLPKAGVFAVRMGPVLARNLRAALGQGRAAAYRPQRHFLALLATADGRAIASRGHLGAEGAWVWHWKHHIDRGFVSRFDMPVGSRGD